MIKNCAFLTTTSSDFKKTDDLLVTPYLEKLSWNLEIIPWHSNDLDWDKFDIVVVRSTWDYHNNLELFLQKLTKINNSSTLLLNSLKSIKWNAKKSYLKDLERRGIATIPTEYGKIINGDHLHSCFMKFNTNELIIKPLTGASAQHVLRINKFDANEAAIKKLYGRSHYLVQPFISSITSNGENSCILFNGKIHHCINKIPAQNDFRVQKEYGGSLSSIITTSRIQKFVNKVIAVLDEVPLYSRVDFVQLQNNQFSLMELELIEPSLHLDMHKDAPYAFANAIEARFNQVL